MPAASWLMNLGLAGEFDPVVTGDAGLLVAMLDGAEDLLDAAATFTGKIYWDYFDDEDDIPAEEYAVLIDGSGDYESTGYGSDYGLQAGDRSVVLLLSRPALQVGGHDASKTDFCEWVEAIIDEIRALCGVEDYYPFETIEKLHPAVRTPRRERHADNDHWWIRYRLAAHPI